MSETSAPSAPPAGEAPRQKTAKELEKERKKAEKLAKFEAKEAAKKKAAAEAGANPSAKKAAAKEQAPIPEFVDKTVPGEKKILLSLDDPALKSYSPSTVESSWYEWWKKQGYFLPQMTADGEIKPEGKYVIPAPPPNVTGALHIGHALTIAIQDSLIRFHRMKGKTTLFVPGFDHAGISTQSVVEKMLWTRSKTTRHDLGREKFVDTVWEWKEDYHERIRKQMERLGASYDWSREAFTLDETRSAAVNEAFVRLFDDGTIYRANRLVNWCVAMNTTLSNLEVENKDIAGKTLLTVPGHDEKIEFGVITSFAYPIEDSDEKIVVATTRPETIFGDTAVAVHPNDPRYTHLHGKFVIHPFLGKRIPIITDDVSVEMEFGTGAVKITPSHDPNDYETGKRHNLEFVNILNDDGTLNENAGPEFKGVKRFIARRLVIEQLQSKGLLIDQKDNPMTIPTCAKSGDIIEPLMKPQWWVKQKEQAQQSIDAVKRGDLVITPKTSENEFFHWMNNIQDWCISRQLWWGHRCPVYFVNREGAEDLDRSDATQWISGRTLEEAEKKAAAKFPGVKYTLEQDEDVLDTWFSSGLWPFSTLGWPNANAEDMKNFYPMSLLETGWDILFFWVARMVMLGIKLTGQVPFKEVFCHSLVRDAQGRKMSKSLGNVIDPLDVISGTSLKSLHDKLNVGNLDPREVEKAKQGQIMAFPNGIPECGTDALRFALCAYTTGGRDINLDIYRIEGYRRFCNKIYQATKFALMRLGPDYVPPAVDSGAKSLVEKWILHKLSVACKLADEGLENNDFLQATNAIYNFWLYELCDVYIENSKFLILEGSAEEKRSAQDTLYTCLTSALELIHPFMPFLTEELWQRIPRRPNDKTESIVVAKYPAVQAFDEKAESSYNVVLDVVKASRSLLSQYGILKDATIIVSATNQDIHKTVTDQEASILSLVKAAKAIETTSDATAPAGSVVSVVSHECSVFLIVKGLVDFDAEIGKAQQKLEKTGKSKQQLDKAMSVKDYETKVRKDVQEGNVKKLENLNAEISGLETLIADFERLKAA